MASHSATRVERECTCAVTAVHAVAHAANRTAIGGSPIQHIGQQQRVACHYGVQSKGFKGDTVGRSRTIGHPRDAYRIEVAGTYADGRRIGTGLRIGHQRVATPLHGPHARSIGLRYGRCRPNGAVCCQINKDKVVVTRNHTCLRGVGRQGAFGCTVDDAHLARGLVQLHLEMKVGRVHAVHTHARLYNQYVAVGSAEGGKAGIAGAVPLSAVTERLHLGQGCTCRPLCPEGGVIISA